MGWPRWPFDPHVIFGPGDTRFLPAVLKHAKSGRLKFQVGLGTWLSDYTYVQNLVDALLLAEEKLAVESALGGEAYFVTNGEPMPFWGLRSHGHRPPRPASASRQDPAPDRLRHRRRQRRHR